MIRVLSVLFMVMLVSGTLHAQQVMKCDVELLGRIEVNVSGLTKKDIRDFLLTFDKSCANNTEYTEFSNELLFEVLYEQPGVMLQVMENEKSKLDTDAILEAMGNPVNDLIEIDQIIARVQRVKNLAAWKDLIIQQLKMAQAKAKKP